MLRVGGHDRLCRDLDARLWVTFPSFNRGLRWEQANLLVNPFLLFVEIDVFLVAEEGFSINSRFHGFVFFLKDKVRLYYTNAVFSFQLNYLSRNSVHS